MTNKEILLEGIFKQIGKEISGYKKAVSSPTEAGGVAGTIGTIAGRVYKSAQDKLAGTPTPATPTPRVPTVHNTPQSSTSTQKPMVPTVHNTPQPTTKSKTLGAVVVARAQQQKPITV